MKRLFTLLLLAPLLLLAGTIKKGTNSYPVITAIPAGSMQSTFSALGSNTVTLYKAANGAASSPLTYRSTSQFNSLTSLVVGDIVTITNNTGSEITVTGLGEANVSSGGAAPALVNITPLTAGATSFTISNVQFTSTTKLFRNDAEFTKPGWSYTNSGGNVTITFANGEAPITTTEAGFVTSSYSPLQYQLN